MKPTALQPDNAFYGHVEVLTLSEISGWVWDPTQPDLKETVDVYSGDAIVQTLTANEPRPDLVIAGVGNGGYGFRGASLLTDLISPVKIVARGTGIILSVSNPDYSPYNLVHVQSVKKSGFGADDINDGFHAVESTPEDAQTSIDDKHGTSAKSVDRHIPAASTNGDVGAAKFEAVITPQFTLAGAISTNEPGVAERTIRLQIDGVEYAKTLADKPVSSEIKGDFAKGNGFYFELPAPSGGHSIKQCTLVWGARVLSIPINYAERYRGNFERYEFGDSKVRVAGWLQDKALEFTPVAIDLFYGDDFIASFTANKTRPDLQANKVGMGNHSFDSIFQCPAPSFDIEKLRMYAGGTNIPVPRRKLALFDVKSSILSKSVVPNGLIEQKVNNRGFELYSGGISRAIGTVDTMSRSEVRGWAYDPDSPEVPVVLDFLIDNQLVASTRTDRFRADLAQKFQTSGYHGFSFEVLPQYALVRWRMFTVVVRRGNVLTAGRSLLKCYQNE